MWPLAAEHPCPCTLLGAERLEPLATALHDVRHVAERLDVVHHRRLAVETLDCRERRLEAWLAAKPLQRLDERRLLTADVRTRAAVHDDVAVETAAEDVLADVSTGARLLDGALEQQSLIVVLTADVDERRVHLQRVRRDQQSLDELMRALIDEIPILEAPRLGLVRVAAEVAREHVLGEEGPLHPGREPRPSPPADVARLHLRDQRLRRELLERVTKSLVAADLLVPLQRLQRQSAPKSLVSSLYSAIDAHQIRCGGTHRPLHPTDPPCRDVSRAS